MANFLEFLQIRFWIMKVVLSKKLRIKKYIANLPLHIKKSPASNTIHCSVDYFKSTD